MRFHSHGELDSIGAPPKLLVSVRNADEACAAIEGGCAILDVKEPARGSLGMASIPEINAVVKTRDRHAPGTPVSVALGEVVDWEGTDASDTGRIRDTLPPGIDFVKLGTAGLGNDLRWSSRFRQIAAPGKPPGETPAPEWVAVAYADWTLAQAPAPRDVVSAAGECSCRGVLIDTFTKEGPGLFGCLTVD
ncbi:MAG TPA: (5-formylfuran-3-yl)methyl phosphate synthase, partial [Planctomycetaceae bacterium]|nr:(5-formylfuran-3-yl)methyl phosphate synthase [Planctomycetaceae bacterium]